MPYPPTNPLVFSLTRIKHLETKMEFTKEQLKIIEEMQKAHKAKLKKMDDFIVVIKGILVLYKPQTFDLDLQFSTRNL